MRVSALFFQTFKESPKDATLPSHQLLHRAGYIIKAGAGLYHYSPLMMRVVNKVTALIKHELNQEGCSEIAMSMVTPAELWQQSGRWDTLGTLMVQFKDRAGRQLCLSPTNEEAVVDYVATVAKSYKQLPICIYQINTKFRDEIRPRFGLMRAREFSMKDAYSFHISQACLDRFYARMKAVYTRIFNAIGLDTVMVAADPGDMADASAQTHEFHAVSPYGEDELVIGDETGLAYNCEMAKTVRAPFEKVPANGGNQCLSTPQASTIDALCEYVKIAPSQTLKAVVFTAVQEGVTQLVVACCLGDDQVNMIKCQAVAGVGALSLLTDDEFKKYGLAKGYIGPVALTSHQMPLVIIIDEQVPEDSALVCGANKPDMHLTDVVLKRDVASYVRGDIRLAKCGDTGTNGESLTFKRGIELGHIFQLGDTYTKALQTTVLGKEGKPMAPLMGCYGIGVGRTIAALVETAHDERGIVWPEHVAPFKVIIIPVKFKDEATRACAERLYLHACELRIEVLLDDRDASPGVKFKDAELIGIPYHIVIGKTFAQSECVEWIDRKTQEKTVLSISDCMAQLQGRLIPS